MTQAMEMHDSWVKDVSRTADGTGYILFHAVVYRSEGTLGADAHVSGYQNVRMKFTDMQFEGPPIPIDEYAVDGTFTVDGVEDPWNITLQVHHLGAIRLTMCLSGLFETHVLTATSAELTVEGDFEPEAFWDLQGNRTSLR